jgi:large conductance mechanosensitive channel
MKKIAGEFKQFIAKGNVMDMAIGIIIGAAFGKIVTSFVNDILMPPAGYLMGGINFADLKVAIGNSSLNYGNFIQTVIDFLIIAFSIFLMIKFINRLKTQLIKEEKKEVKDETPEDVKLLREIRDALKK